MKVKLPRLATRKQKRRMRRFLREVELRTTYPVKDLPITVKFQMWGGLSMFYRPEKSLITVPRAAWSSTRGTREMWQGTLCHEVAGHAFDFHKVTPGQRAEFFELAAGRPPQGFSSAVGHENAWPYSVISGDDRLYWWGGDLWYRRVGELFADVCVEAFSDFDLNRNSNPDALQVTPELVEMTKALA